MNYPFNYQNGVVLNIIVIYFIHLTQHCKAAQFNPWAFILVKHWRKTFKILYESKAVLLHHVQYFIHSPFLPSINIKNLQFVTILSPVLSRWSCYCTKLILTTKATRDDSVYLTEYQSASFLLAGWYYQTWWHHHHSEYWASITEFTQAVHSWTTAWWTAFDAELHDFLSRTQSRHVSMQAMSHWLNEFDF